MKSFNEIYEKIYKNNIGIMDNIEEKKKNIKKIEFLFAMAIFCFFLPSFVIFIISYGFGAGDLKDIYNEKPHLIYYFFGSWICVTLLHKKLTKIDKIDKQLNLNNINNFLNEIDSNLLYIPDKGIPSDFWDMGELTSLNYTRYHSEDYIEGTLNNKRILMSDVKIERSSGKNKIVIQGLFAKVDFDKNINSKIKICCSSSIKAKDKIEMDSGEFEEIFEVYSEEKMVTMQILTSDIMEEIIKFVERTKSIPEFTIKENNIYILFLIGDTFSATITKGSFDYKTLKKYYDIFNFIDIITEKISKNIEYI